MAGPIITLGDQTPGEQSFEYRYDPSSGGQQTYEFDTFSEQNAVNLANANIAARVPTIYRLVLGRATVILADSNFPGIDKWQVIANEVSKSRYDAPAMLRILKYGDGTDFYDSQIQLLKSGIDNKSKFSGLSIDPSIVGSDLDYLNNVYTLIFRGSDSYPFSQYVLKHETLVGNSYASNVADVNVDCVYTVAQLLSETQNPASWIFPLPGEYQYFIQNLPAPSPQSGYLWGWLKRSGTRTDAANNRVTLCTEYWLEQWEQTQLGSFGSPAYG